MKFENTEVMNFSGALRGMRNPLASWDRSDSGYGCKKENKVCNTCPSINNEYEYGLCRSDTYIIGPNDMKLAQRLIKAGPEHRKFLRQIFVSVDITAAIFWWKECDTYKIGTTANSTSTMHKLATTPITMECFECDDLAKDLVIYEKEPFDVDTTVEEFFQYYLEGLEALRCRFNETKDKRYWKELVRLLPESWLQTRTVTMNYEIIRNIVKQRTGHKLIEWKAFIDWAHTLPYANELIFYEL